MATMNSVANFFWASRPINFSPFQIAAAVHSLQLGPITHNRNFQRAAFSTGIISTGLALSVFYSGVLHNLDGPQANNTLAPVQWLEYPADYVPPVMNLFVEDHVPFGVSSPLSCPKDSEHLEKAFDLLRYRHLSKELGVPSVVKRNIVIRILRILGNTSSGSTFPVLASSALPSDVDNRSTKRWLRLSSHRSNVSGGPLPADIPALLGNEGQERHFHHWFGINMASVVFAITVVGLLANHRKSRSPSVSSPKSSLVDNIQGRDIGCCECNGIPISYQLVFALFDNPYPSVEQVLEDGGSDDPCVLLKLLDYSCSQSDDVAPSDDFWTLCVTLWDSLPSVPEIRRMASNLPRHLVCVVVFRAAILACFALRLLGFAITGHFGRRGIRKLGRQLKRARSSITNLADATTDSAVAVPTRTPGVLTISSHCTQCSTVETVSDNGYSLNYLEQEMYEDIVMGWITDWYRSQIYIQSRATSTSVSLVDKVVETTLAPNIDKDNVAGNNEGCAVAEDEVGDSEDTGTDAAEASNSTSSNSYPDDEGLPLPFMKRLRGRRTHGRRGRKS